MLIILFLEMLKIFKSCLEKEKTTLEISSNFFENFNISESIE
jgi:hypothetical protein